MPKTEAISRMVERGGEGLTFSIKAHKGLTHEVQPQLWREEAARYRRAIEPLLEAGRLETVLFQFPYSFHYTDDNRRYLSALMNEFNDIPRAVEFRGSDWFTNSMIDGMRRSGITLVSLDMPDLENLPPQTDIVTGKTAFLRLHGRNKGAWWGSDSAGRYDYLYDKREIDAVVARLERLIGQVSRILVYFNNHRLAKAVANAKELIERLQGIAGAETVQAKGAAYGAEQGYLSY
jgi:uncharacterized protein YecE (DUF72 family)